MQGIIEFFVSNPEAVASLMVFAVGGLASTIALLYGTFAKFPLIVRIIENRSLVYVDSALRDKVQVAFSHREGTVDVRELRQIDLEIINSDPRRKVEDCAVTINLCSPNATVLGVTAANSDGRTPTLGGRRTITSVESISAQPADPILGPVSDELFSAVVVRIPYLERVIQNDRVFLRITYDGPELEPEIQGAKPASSSQYRRAQWLCGVTAALVLASTGLAMTAIAHRQEGLPFLFPELFRNPCYLAGLSLLGVAFIVEITLILASRWVKRLVRTPPNLLIPPPLEEESLAHFRFYDTMQERD